MQHHYYDAASLVTFFFSLYLSLSHCATRGTYAHATWQRLQPFFRLPGRIQWGHDAVHIDLRPFNNRQLTRDLLAVCQRANEIQPRLPDGRLLILHAPSLPFG
jgi:hypothetical protein